MTGLGTGHPLAPMLAGSVRLLCGGSSRWVGVTPEPVQRIYCANHTSHLDALVIWAALPPQVRARTRPVAAADYWRGGLRQWLATKVFRAILLERGTNEADPAARRARAIAAVERTAAAMGEDSVILFPEGTRGSGGSMGPFKSGVYHLWRLRPQAQVVPVHLHNLGRVLPKGEFAPVPLLASVTLGPPLALAPDCSCETFLSELRMAIEGLGAV